MWYCVSDITRMDWEGLIVLILITMSLHSSVLSCPEECECYHDINLYAANCSSIPTSNENELAKIEVLNLSPTLLVPLALREGWFVGFKKLKYLSLSNCSIYYIHKKAFYGLKHLIEIDLSFNDIQTLDPLVFQHNNDLTSLILRGNPIKFTANTPFLVSNTIQHLDLGLSSIKSIPRGVFFGVKKIMHMSLDGNHLQTLKYNSLPRGIKYLNIANNMIVNVPTQLLASLTNLHRLDLSGNPINCTCPLMYLQDWLSGRGVTFDNEVICASPPQYAGRSWNEVNENELCIPETLIDDMQKKPLKKITKNGLKNKQKYFLSNDKNKHLETAALQADEPVYFLNEKMDPNAEILFQNDDTRAMGVMMEEKESTKTEKPDENLENDTDGGDDIENDTIGGEITHVEDASKKTAFDDLDSDDPGLKEEANENKEDEIEPAESVITSNVENDKQHNTENDGMIYSEDHSDILTETEPKNDEQNLQNDDVNNADSVKGGEEEIIETTLTDDAKKEIEEKSELDSSPAVIQNAEENKKDPIPVEDHESEYDKAASEALLTDGLIPQKVENSAEKNSAEKTLIENAPDENKEKELVDISLQHKLNEETITEEENSEINKENFSEVKEENIEDHMLLSEEINNKTQNKIKEDTSKTETDEVSNLPQNEIKEEILKSENAENVKDETAPAYSEDENKSHLPHGSALDKELLAQEDLIATIGAGVKDGDVGDIDSTEEPVKNIDENNIDTSVIIKSGEKFEEKLGQIKAAESVDEHEKIENSDLKPETDMTAKKTQFAEPESHDLAPPLVSAEDESRNVEGVVNIDNVAVVVDSQHNTSKTVEESVNPLLPIVVNNNVIKEEIIKDESAEKANITSKNENDFIAQNKEETTTPQISETNVDTSVLTVVETESGPKDETEIIKTDDHIESRVDEKLDNLIVNKNSLEGATNENEGAEVTAEPQDSKENFKNKLNEEMFMTDISSEINNDDYDISTTQAPDISVPVEESKQNVTPSIQETDVKTEINATKIDSSQQNKARINVLPDVSQTTEEAEVDEPLTTVSEEMLSKQNSNADETQPHEHEHEHEHVELEKTTDESVTDTPETTVVPVGDVSEEVTPGETMSGNDSNILLVGTDKKHNADIKEDLKPFSDDEVLQEAEPFEFQESHIVLACILVLVLALILFSVYKCASNKTKSTKRITKDIESNHGTEMQDMASLLPKPSEDDNKSTKKYSEDASSNEKVKLITEEKEEDDNQYQRGNETQAVVEKENTLNNNAPNSPNKPTPVNRTAAPATINPAAPIQRTKVKVAIIPESIPRTPIFVQKTYNNGVSTNG